MLPLISVLIPVYEVEEYLDRCVRSVLAQTYENFEIVMVDDGSKDRSAEIASRYAEEHENIRLIRSEHVGVSHARNILLENAKGEYVFFLDSDDNMNPRTLEVLYNLLKEKNADIVQCEMKKMWKTQVLNTSSYIEVYKNDIVERFCCWQSGLLRCMLAAKLYKKTMFCNVHFPEGKTHEDEATMHRILENAHCVACTSEAFYQYYYNPNSITKRKFSDDRYDILDAMEDRLLFCLERNLDFAADMTRLHMLLLVIELYRRTVNEVGTGAEALIWLNKRSCTLIDGLLTTNYFNSKICTLFTVWKTNPMQGELPNFKVISTDCWNKRGDIS